MSVPGRSYRSLYGATVTNIHPLAIVSPGAVLGKNVSIGPFSIIEAGALVADDCRLASRVVVKSGTRLGRGNEIGEGAVLGGKPQHVRAGTEHGGLTIGEGNVIRENATLHRALKPGNDTRVGDGNLIMVNAHVAHDCVVGDYTIMANNVMLAGHVTIGQRAYLSGAVGVHQFCRIGAYAMVGGQAHITRDVPPFVTVDGQASQVVGLNLIGLKRHGFSAEQIFELKAAYRVIYKSDSNWNQMLGELQTQFAAGPAADFAPFLAACQRGIVQERRGARGVKLKVLSSDEESLAPARSRRRAA
jgi:UDP-N-acetylglucosamine acyltransferase